MSELALRCVTLVFFVCMTAMVPIIILHTAQSTKADPMENSALIQGYTTVNALTRTPPRDSLEQAFPPPEPQQETDSWRQYMILYMFFGWICAMIGFLFYYYARRYRRHTEHVFWVEEPDRSRTRHSDNAHRAMDRRNPYTGAPRAGEPPRIPHTSFRR
jgi:hypothetical protein